MGLFSNNKKLCPICNGPTPRLLATKIEGEAICSDCANKIQLPLDRSSALTMAEFMDYLHFYDDENAPLRACFSQTFARSGGLFSTTSFVCDEKNHLFKINKADAAIVFPGSALVRMTVSEDDTVIMDLTPSGLTFYPSDVPYMIENNYTQAIADFNMRHDLFALNERQQRRDERDDPGYMATEPSFDVEPPFRKFNIDLQIDSPWWTDAHMDDGAVQFNTSRPSIHEYMDRYDGAIKDYKQLMMAFHNTCFPDTPVGDAQAQATGAAPEQVIISNVSSADELMKFKTLLDQGVITQEEFDAKKKQLLGL